MQSCECGVLLSEPHDRLKNICIFIPLFFYKNVYEASGRTDGSDFIYAEYAVCN